MTHQLTTTLNRIKAHNLSHAGWKTLLAGLGKSRADNKPLPFATILRINGLDFALWCARAEPQHSRVWRLFAVWCGRQGQHLLTDPRSIAALDVVERHANGMATDEELRAAEAAAWAAWAAARHGAGDGALATWATALAARAAARAAAGDGALATWATALAARAAARHGAREAQVAEFLRIVGGE
jgi:hypothetical protein